MAAETTLLPILNASMDADFDSALRRHDLPPLRRGQVTTLQINVGKLCNQACHHCHVEAGPKRSEIMSADVGYRILELLARTASIQTVDITGGAPELNANFKRFVLFARSLGLHVIDRCNLTVFFEPDQTNLADFLAEHQVEIVASLPCYTAENVDQQRGRGVFEKSVAALRKLNRLGYGQPNSSLLLNLVYNPLGASLPPAQEQLEADYKKHLRQEFGIEFNRLFTITNMPIRRFTDFLVRTGKLRSYTDLLVNSFNPATVEEVMCRSLVSVGWDGQIYDCDFNQMLDITATGAQTIWEIESFNSLQNASIATAGHCFGCTAGSGSSCGGSLQ